MKIGTIGPNTVSISYPKCIIQFSLEPNGLDLYTIFISPETRKRCTLLQLMAKKGHMGKKVITDEEVQTGEKIGDKISRDIFFDSIIIPRYCSEIVAGDFSIVDTIFPQGT